MSTFTHRAKSKQAWATGDIVNIGFIKGLVVKAKIATPGDGRPDFHVLWQPATNRWYSFQPHYGILRHESREEAEAAS